MVLLMLAPKLALKKMILHNKSTAFNNKATQDIQDCCYNIFRENNRNIRDSFFNDPFIQYIWTIFIEEKPQTVNDILRFVRSIPNEGEFKFGVFMDDIEALEQKFHFMIVPNGAENRDTVSPFSVTE